jgi:hypothetical protein
MFSVNCMCSTNLYLLYVSMSLRHLLNLMNKFRRICVQGCALHMSTKANGWISIFELPQDEYLHSGLKYRTLPTGGMPQCSWLRHCATSRKIAGSIPDSVIGIFHWHNPSGRTMALGLTQPLTEMRTRNISWEVNPAGAYGWQPYHLHVPTVLKSKTLNLLEPSGPVQACNGNALPLRS